MRETGTVPPAFRVRHGDDAVLRVKDVCLDRDAPRVPHLARVELRVVPHGLGVRMLRHIQPVQTPFILSAQPSFPLRVCPFSF